MRVLTVIGNRPQFVKAAAVSRLLRAEHEEILVHTGQHHDDELSTIFFESSACRRPSASSGIHGGTNTAQTARMLAALDAADRDRSRPDVVLVYGDTNSTLAGGLAAAQARVPVAHVEAGMRSFDRAMPEELQPRPHRPPLRAAAGARPGRRRQPRRARVSPGASRSSAT